ncbi:hypothetical protein B0H13DRAFT_1941867 [Mycena leptocephala]|nr:hypothetical protein B0H13DRAFT_1941867 [Mycena leptocephala]
MSSSLNMTFGAGFEERNRALRGILEHLATIYPRVGVLVITFKAFVAVEAQRRTNDPKIIALLVKVQDTMTVFVQSAPRGQRRDGGKYVEHHHRHVERNQRLRQPMPAILRAIVCRKIYQQGHFL